MKLRSFLSVLLFCSCLPLFAAEDKPAESVKVIKTHALALLGEPKYKEGFEYFDYVNPAAPKGGTLTMGLQGTYDNFNRFAQRGVAAIVSDWLYDTLLTGSQDEIDVYYGLIAESIEYAADFSWVIFHINPHAKFQDGKQITAGDVVFTFEKFLKEGVPSIKVRFKSVKECKALDKLRVRFSLEEGSKELLLALGGLRILPPQYWKDKDFSEPLTEVPLGSSMYTISDYKIGQYVVYKRLPDYWAKDLPVLKGQGNFDYRRYDYYLDENVLFEAFKAGEIDLRIENVAKNWATGYEGKNFDKKYLIKEEIPHNIPRPMQCLVFNIQRPFFSDARVREALSLVFDFEWMNKNLFYSQYKRMRSFFTNTPYEATGKPGKEELKILTPFKDQLPEALFSGEYNPSRTNGSGNIRNQMRKALGLLKEAGWEVQDEQLKNKKTGKPFEFEVIYYASSSEKYLIPYKKNLEKLGITLNLRLLDSAQYNNRMRERDYDMMGDIFVSLEYPSGMLLYYFHSDYRDYTYNSIGVDDELVDSLIDSIMKKQEDMDALIAYGRALDRVLTWRHYVIPEWTNSSFRVAYWNKFEKPAVRPEYSLGESTWWVDPGKEKKLPADVYKAERMAE